MLSSARVRTPVARTLIIAVATAAASLSVVLSPVQPTEAQAAPAKKQPVIALGWGNSNTGALGNGSTARVKTPSRVLLPSGLTTVVGGREHTLGVTSSGKVWAWGRNDQGQLGDKTRTTRLGPVKVRLPKGVKVKAVAADEDHSLAVDRSGEVYAWGADGFGQLGDGKTKTRLAPHRVAVPGRVVAVATGRQSSYATTSSGRVYAWGRNGSGQLGIGSTKDRDHPRRVKLPSGAKVVEVASGTSTTLAVTSKGKVLAWGSNRSRMVGDGTSKDRSRPRPVKLPRDSKVAHVAAGDDVAVALTRQGRVLTWGRVDDPRLGRGAHATSRPKRVAVPGRVKQVATAGSHTVVLTRSGRVLAWGANHSSQLGDGSIKDRAVPRRVKLPRGTVVRSVSVGGWHTFVLTKPGRPTAVSLTPAEAQAQPGRDATFATAAFDVVGHQLSARGTTLTIEGGSCSGLRCRAQELGPHIVTARYRGLTAAATLTVTETPSAGSSTAAVPPSSSGPMTAPPTSLSPTARTGSAASGAVDSVVRNTKALLGRVARMLTQ